MKSSIHVYPNWNDLYICDAYKLVVCHLKQKHYAVENNTYILDFYSKHFNCFAFFSK